MATRTQNPMFSGFGTLEDLARTLSSLIPDTNPNLREDASSFYGDSVLSDAFSSRSNAQDPGTEEDYKNSILEKLFAGGSDYGETSKPYGQARQDYFNSGNMTYPGRTGDNASSGMGQYSDPESGNAYEAQELKKFSAIIGMPGRVVSKLLSSAGVRDPIPEIGDALTSLAKPVEPQQASNDPSSEGLSGAKSSASTAMDSIYNERRLQGEKQRGLLELLKGQSSPDTLSYTGNSDGVTRGDGSELTSESMRGGNFSRTNKPLFDYPDVEGEVSEKNLVEKYRLNPATAPIFSKRFKEGDDREDQQTMRDMIPLLKGQGQSAQEILTQGLSELLKGKADDLPTNIPLVRRFMLMKGIPQEDIDQVIPEDLMEQLMQSAKPKKR